MLSYQHHYHAGNHADVLKHWLLTECLVHLRKKEKPFDYIDTHAGAGRYRLDSEAAQKIGEYKNGIEKLLDVDWPECSDYLNAVRSEVVQHRYPGSPGIVNQFLRPGDHSSLFELHPKTVKELEQNCARRRQTKVFFEDGYKGLNALLPVASRRALILIDPSYEVKSEYDSVVKVIEAAWKKMPQAIFLLWFPVVDRNRINRLEKRFEQSYIRKIEFTEMCIASDDEKGMTGSGLITINAPWTLEARFNRVMPKVSERLSVDGVARVRYKVITPE